MTRFVLIPYTPVFWFNSQDRNSGAPAGAAEFFCGRGADQLWHLAYCRLMPTTYRELQDPRNYLRSLIWSVEEGLEDTFQ